MPLLDHFHAPLYPNRAWESFHSRWANSIADGLNSVLPPRYFTEVQIHLGSMVEADVAEFESTAAGKAENGSPGVALSTWSPPAATTTIAAVFPDDIEVHVRDERDDARLVAAVELVSPRNKDRPEARRAFAAKCAAYLQRGIGLAIVDIVSIRQANLFDELMRLLAAGEAQSHGESVLHAAAFRPVHHPDSNQFEIWFQHLQVGQPLPLVPLAVRGYGMVPLDLEASYSEARERSRI
jgi:hypothetical protein